MSKKSRRRPNSQQGPKSIWNSQGYDNFGEMSKIILSTRKNDPCWCGSGEKFENCHQNRFLEPALRMHEYIKVLRKFFDKGYCLHPEAHPNTCRNPIVRAHTVQRNGGLSRIARDGHVYTFSSEKNLSQKEIIAPTLVGIKKASTFTGFCSFHDSTTFEPVEQHPFQNTPQHTFLLGYRAICHELFLKKMSIDLIFPYQQRHVDRGKPEYEQMMLQTELHYLTEGYIIGLRDLMHYKAAYDRALLSGDYSKVSYYLIRFSNIPDFLCSAPHMPDCDFSGRTLQNVLDTTSVVDHLTFSLIATDTGGAAVFSWVGKSEAAEQFVKSLHAFPDDEITHALVRFTFEYFENVFASPIWWESLDTSTQQALLNRQMAGLPHTGRTADCLVDDGIRAVNWTVSLRRTNLIV